MKDDDEDKDEVEDDGWKDEDDEDAWGDEDDEDGDEETIKKYLRYKCKN